MKLLITPRRLDILRRAKEIYRRAHVARPAWRFDDVYGGRVVDPDVQVLIAAGLAEPGPEEMRGADVVAPLRLTAKGEAVVIASRCRQRVSPITHRPEVVKSAREARGWNQCRLARELGISRSLMCEIERGSRGVSPSLFLRIAAVLECPVESLKAQLADTETPGGAL